MITSSSASTTWSPDMRLTTDPSSDWSPSIAQMSDGKIWVVWHSYRTGDAEIFCNIYNGTSWSSDTQLTTDPSQDANPSIMQSVNGTIWVFWASNRAGQYDLFYKTSSDVGSSWSPDMRLTTDPSSDRVPSIAQMSDGKIWVFWGSTRTGNDDVFYKTSSDGGATWTSDIQLTWDESRDITPSIMQSVNGTIWVFWASFRTGNHEIFYKTSSDGGSSWSPETQLTTDPDMDSFPSPMQAKDGDIWVVWQSDRISMGDPPVPQDDLFYKIHDGLSWSSDTRLTQNASDDIMPSIIHAADTGVWVAWTSGRVDNFEIYYKTAVGFPEFHDVAVKSVTPSQTVAHQGYAVVDIYVEVGIDGTSSETFSVTAYYNSTAIGTQTITIWTYTTLTFPWNTADIPYGNYTISANASTVLDETDLTDNSFTDDTVIVTIPGDVNGDRMVDILDATVISSAYWDPPYFIGPLGYYDPNADVNNDGKVDLVDLVIININWHSSW